MQSNPRQRCTLGIAALCALGGGCGSPGGRSSDRLTFSEHIAPIIWRHCSGCHRPGEVGPFNLIEYGEVRSRGQQIVRVTSEGLMPPWLPEAGYGQFAGERRLTPADIAAIGRWVAGGAPEGDPARRPEPPAWPDEWQLGRPDLVVSLPEPYVLSAGGSDVFRNFVIPLPLGARRYVRGIEVRPSPASVAHHATVLFDRTRASRRLDESDPVPGYEGMFSDTARNPDSHAIGWTPGSTPFLDPPAFAWRLDRGSDLVVQLHMIPSGKPERVGLSVGFFFSDETPTRMPIDVKLGSKTIDIPAGDAGYWIDDRFVLPVDVSVLSVYPHAHYLAREMKAFATMPGGSVAWLLWIKNWDFRWQDQYRYTAPMTLPAGAVVTMQYRYDNSASNPRNPRQPPARVIHGPQSTDEMGDLWLRLLPRRAEEGAALARAYQEHELRAEIAAAELKAAREPENATWQNVLGIRYIEAGRIAEGIERLQHAIRLAPAHAEAHNNLGHALQRQGKLREAVMQFREAARLAPENDRVLFNLAGALQDAGQYDEAIRHYERGLQLNPDAAGAHNDLGAALASTGRIAEAARHFRLALDIDPDHVDARRNLALALDVDAGSRR